MGSTVELKRFEYRECADAPFVPSWTEWNDASETVPEEDNSEHDAAAIALDARLTQEKERAFEEGRACGIEEGRAAERASGIARTTVAEDERIRRVTELLAGFEKQREDYFRDAEQEVVQLALAVAARILWREAQADPLLLMGAVRVALGQITAAAEVRLLVPKPDVDLWTEAIALLPNLRSKPRVIGKEGMRVGECVIETELGKADISIPAQLSEVERSLNRKGGKDNGSARNVCGGSK
jgi:flagellar assembly protein FliH